MHFALCGARIHQGVGFVEGAALIVRDGYIANIVARAEVPAGIPIVELDGGTLAAGFIDVQVNGGGGLLFNDEPNVDSLRTIAAAHRSYGTTGFLPTIISDDAAKIDLAMRAVEQAIADGVPGILGIHIEGPMLSPARHGIHDPRFIRRADADLLDLVCSLRAGRTLVTVAPEIVKADAIRHLVDRNVIVAAGHTDATYDEMRQAFEAGVSGITHLFNAMSAMTSRAPGAVGAALENGSAWCGIIADGVHVHPAVLRVALRSRPLDRFVLVTDAMSPVGTDAKAFILQGREIQVTADRCVDAEGTLAGSNLTMIGAVRNSVELMDLPLSSALQIASETPAAFMGMTALRGTLDVGKAADLVWLDDALTVKGTWIAGVTNQEKAA